jgi:iron(III) transport system substrate-binding protein
VRSTPARLTCGAALAALVLTACGGSPTAAPAADPSEGAEAETTEAQAVYEEIGALTGQERRDRLVSCAEEEGELALYTSMTADVADVVVEAFEDTFDLDVSIYRAGSETVLQRILQEQAADFHGNDVVETNATELFALQNEGFLADYAGERREMVPEAGRFDGWTATRFNLFSPSWNTNKVSPEEAPTSWEDLADPKWDGRMAMELGDYDWYLTLYNYWLEQGKSEEEVEQLFADMADGAKVVKGHTVMGELLSAGQYDLAASNYTYLTQNVVEKGAPVAYTPLVEPVIARPNGAGLMKTAQHPCAGMLFKDWILEEGQAVLAEEGLTPSIAEGGGDLEGVEVIPVDVETLLESGQEWSDRYDALVQGGEQIDG